MPKTQYTRNEHRVKESPQITLRGTQVSDAGLGHLQGLTKLEGLELDGTQVTDVGLVHLQRLTRLKLLGLVGTQVTDDGVIKLQQALPNCVISHHP